MKILLSFLAFLNGGYMLADGLYVMLKGKYIGPAKPGPWANLFYKLNIDVFRLGPLFIIYGLLWLAWLYGFWTGQSWAFAAGLLIAILTLWYLPVGAFISIILIVLLFLYRQRLGL